MIRRMFGGRLLRPNVAYSRCLKIERLEDRTLPAVLIVNSPFDDNVTGDGLVTLREAVAAANGNLTTDLGQTGSGQDTIQFEPGVFNSPREITLTLGEIKITEALVLQGPGLAKLTVNGNQSSRIFRVDDGNNSSNSNVEISGLRLTGGVATGGGGAILSHENLILRDMLIAGNRADYGGGIRLHSHSGGTTVLNSSITGNIAEFEGGGLRALTYTGAQITIRNSVISGNSAGFDGGGLGAVTYAGGTLALEASSISGNTASFRGGGISARTYGGQTRIQSSTVSGNTVSGGTDGGGGALYSRNFGTVSVQNSTFSGNMASLDGGAIYSRNYGSTAIQNATIAYNRSDSDNNGSGGGDVVHSASGSVLFENSILVGTANLLSGNVSVTYSLIGNNSGTSLSEAPVGNPDANGNLIGGPVHGPIDPLLGTLSSNNGPTAVHIPLVGSPVIDTGVPGFVGTPVNDQRGAPYQRVADGGVQGQRIDMGAVEIQSVVPGAAGDYDRDGDVDADDYRLWKLTFSSNSSLAADGNANDVVDAADYTVWRDRAFATSGGAAILPDVDPESSGNTAVVFEVLGNAPGTRLAAFDVADNASLFGVPGGQSSSLNSPILLSSVLRQEGNRNANLILSKKASKLDAVARNGVFEEVAAFGEPVLNRYRTRRTDLQQTGTSETTCEHNLNGSINLIIWGAGIPHVM